MSENRDIRIHVPVLARVEGEGALELMARDGRIETLHLRIFEPPRLFEKFLEGRSYNEVIDTVARICGICPVAYQMSAVQALEGLFGVEPEPAIRDLRRLLYCGEWIQSHALHIHMLAAPDFLGCKSVVELAAIRADEVRRGLRLQELGNRIMRLLGGRSVHPVGVCVGGLYAIPAQEELDALRDALEEGIDAARELVLWTASLPLPEDTQGFVSVALQAPAEYAIDKGRIVSSNGLDIPIEDYQQHFREQQMPHSTALYSALDGKPYLVGPLARLNLNTDSLPDSVLEVLEHTGIRFPSRNMFHSIVARAVEIHYALVEAVHLLDKLTRPAAPSQPVSPVAGTAYGCTEAPRGILWQRYVMHADGWVRQANIIPPTSQNQARIEEDLRHSLERLGLDNSDEVLRLRGETVIRNYDPCISCATHSLNLRINRQ